ncbi:MAG TPA: TetR/AcrR family transcriptional regulator [Candidatus Dormibacteraeota bacterium]|nr:TetR/AcrR family transcriptional regulator [Candidatus Dormibacteraeota bacterium]
MPRTALLRDSEAKLQHILQHSAQIFANRGFAGASMRDVSRSTGISLSGLYYYFKSKQELLYLIQKKAFTSVVHRLQSELPAVSNPQARLKLFISNHLDYFLAHPAEMKVLSHEDDALEEPYKKEIGAIKRRYYNLACEIFEDVTREKTAGLANPRIAILILYGMMNWIYKWHNAAVDPSAEELSETICSIFLHGALNGRNGATADGPGRNRLSLEKIGTPE